VARYLFGLDTEHNTLVEFDANNFGAAVYSSADGWVGAVLTMTSSVSTTPRSSYAINRFIYSILGPKTFTIDWQISKTAEPNWITADHLNCQRVP
jgi:hypothetical protein